MSKEKNIVIQRSPKGMWLYNGDLDDKNCVFSHKITRHKDTEPWCICTDEEKKEWEEQFKESQLPTIKIEGLP